MEHVASCHQFTEFEDTSSSSSPLTTPTSRRPLLPAVETNLSDPSAPRGAAACPDFSADPWASKQAWPLWTGGGAATAAPQQRPSALTTTFSSESQHGQSPPSGHSPQPSNVSPNDNIISPWWDVTAPTNNRPLPPTAPSESLSSAAAYLKRAATIDTSSSAPPQPLSLDNVTLPMLDPSGHINPPPPSRPLDYFLPGLPLQSDSISQQHHGAGGAQSSNSTGAQNSISDLLVTPTHLPPLRPPRPQTRQSAVEHLADSVYANAGAAPNDHYLQSLSEEDDDRCEVCWENHNTEADPIIECAGCGVLVHHQCYGVCKPTKDQWFCCVCLYWKQLGLTPWNPRSTHRRQDVAATDSSVSVDNCNHKPSLCPPPLLYCVICHRPKGAMKVGIEGKWVHVSCVLYNQDGPCFRNVANRTAPINIQKSLVAHSRSRFGCSICRSNEGYTTGCSFPGCLKRVHVACAFNLGLRPKLQTISAEVPIYSNNMFWQMTGTVESSETRIVEKLLKIVTCQTHSSPDAHNAVEEWERKMLKKADLIAEPNFPHSAYIPPPATDLPPTAPLLTRPDGTTGAPGTGGGGGALSQGMGDQSPWMSAHAAAHHPSFPQAFNPYQQAYGFVPPRGLPGANTYFLSPAWGMSPYASPPGGFGSYHRPRPGHYGATMFSPPAPAMFGMDGRNPAAAASGYHPSFWPPTGFAGVQHMHRHAATTPYGRSTGTHGVRVAVGVNKSLGGPLGGNRGVKSGEMHRSGGVGELSLTGEGQEGTSPTSRQKVKVPKSSRKLATDGGMSTTSAQGGAASALGLTKVVKTGGSSKAKLVKSASLDTASQLKKRKSSAGGGGAGGTSQVKSTMSSSGATTQYHQAKSATGAAGRPSGSASRRRLAEDDEDVGTASGHVVGSAVSSRGLKVVWSKADPHFKSLRGASNSDPLLTFLMSCETECQNPSAAFNWRWIFTGDLSSARESDTTYSNIGSSAKAPPGSESSKQMDTLRKIWMSHCGQQQTATSPLDAANEPISKVTAPVSVVVTTEVMDEAERHSWTLWKVDPKSAPLENAEVDEGETPSRRATVRSHQEECSFMLDGTKLNDVREEPVKTCGETSSVETLNEDFATLLQAFRVSKSSADLLKSAHISHRELSRSLAKEGETTEEAKSAGTKEGTLKTASQAASEVKRESSSGGSPLSVFEELVEKALAGHEDPTGARQSTMKPFSSPNQDGGPVNRKKVPVDLSCWNEIQRLETALLRKQTVPPFFILCKKPPAELVGRQPQQPLSGNTASHQAGILQKFMENKDSVCYTLDASALRKIGNPTKKMCLHGRIWDLNPPFPTGDSILRSLLPAKSRAITLDSTQKMIHPNASPEEIIIPIIDDATKEFLSMYQKSRSIALSAANAATAAAAGSLQGDKRDAQGRPISKVVGAGELTPEDRLKAAKGEEFIKLATSEAYWNALLLHDDFVRRQAVFNFMLWLKRRSRLRNLTAKLMSVVRSEIRCNKRCIEIPSVGESLRKATDEVSRWTAVRSAFYAGHQDPTQQLIERVEQEKTKAEQQTGPAPEDASATSLPVSATGIARTHFCVVCFGTDPDNLNPLVTCHWCGIKVHKNCYAIGHPAQLDLDVLEWYCERCEVERKGVSIFTPGSCRCCLCLRPGGALKRLHSAAHPRAYIHLTCATWLFPSIKCHNIAKLTDWRIDPSTNISKFQACDLCSKTVNAANSKRHMTTLTTSVVGRRKVKILRIAEEDESSSESAVMMQPALEETIEVDETPTVELPFGEKGLTVRCAYPNCSKTYHPLCAWLLGLQTRVTNDYLVSVFNEPEVFGPALKVDFFCERHVDPDRLPCDLIAAHRGRCYICKDTGGEQPPLTLPMPKSSGDTRRLMANTLDDSDRHHHQSALDDSPLKDQSPRAPTETPASLPATPMATAFSPATAEPAKSLPQLEGSLSALSAPTENSAAAPFSATAAPSSAPTDERSKEAVKEAVKEAAKEAAKEAVKLGVAEQNLSEEALRRSEKLGLDVQNGNAFGDSSVVGVCDSNGPVGGTAEDQQQEFFEVESSEGGGAAETALLSRDLEENALYRSPEEASEAICSREVTKAEDDVVLEDYSFDTCQSCLRVGGERPLEACAQCGKTRVHSRDPPGLNSQSDEDCWKGTMSDSPPPICTSCSSADISPACVLCPRLGGALTKVSLDKIKQVLERCPFLTPHGHQIVEDVTPTAQNELLLEDSKQSAEAAVKEDVQQEEQEDVALPVVDEQMALVHKFCFKQISNSRQSASSACEEEEAMPAGPFVRVRVGSNCDICRKPDGILCRCAHCDQSMAHPLCAALVGNWHFALQEIDEGPTVKRRKTELLTAPQRTAEDVETDQPSYICADHPLVAGVHSRGNADDLEQSGGTSSVADELSGEANSEIEITTRALTEPAPPCCRALSEELPAAADSFENVAPDPETEEDSQPTELEIVPSVEVTETVDLRSVDLRLPASSTAVSDDMGGVESSEKSVANEKVGVASGETGGKLRQDLCSTALKGGGEMYVNGAASSTPTNSDVSRRKRKRRIVAEESSDDSGGGAASPAAAPAATAATATVTPAAMSIPRKRGGGGVGASSSSAGTKRQRVHSPPAVKVKKSMTAAASSSSISIGGGGAQQQQQVVMSPSSTPVSPSSKKKKQNMPLRNEKGQFIKRSSSAAASSGGKKR